MYLADYSHQVATTRIDTLEHLLGAYEEIGEVIQGLRQYDRLFRNHPDVRGVLERYFYDVLQFHQCVLEVFARPCVNSILLTVIELYPKLLRTASADTM
jgi:hypothetical protein